MLKFFRNIRQSLLTEDKFSKYLLYALGEIILVVIGKLLALQINNWKEARNRKIEEEKLLIALAEDFKENKIRIQEAISKETNMIASYSPFSLSIQVLTHLNIQNKN